MNNTLVMLTLDSAGPGEPLGCGADSSVKEMLSIPELERTTG